MSGIVCPRCKKRHDAAVERDATGFCECDYPLFFVPAPLAPEPEAAVPVAEAGATAPAPVIEPAALRPCPACLALNPVAGVFCTACGHALDADPGPLFDPNPPEFPPPPTPSSGAFILSLLALLVALAALAVALYR